MIQRHDLRTRTAQKYGKPNVTYPYGDLRFPRIVEARTVTKGPNSAAIPFLTPHRDQGSYPGAVLIEQTSDAGDNTEKNVTETYEVLPGPISVEVSEMQDTGIPILIARRKVAVPDDYPEGELLPTALNLVSIAGGNMGNPCLVTLSGAHHLPPRAWVTFDGTNSTPALDGPRRIVAVPAENQVQIAVNVTGAGGAAGTMTGIHRIVREMKPTANVNILMKVESMIAVPDVTVYNEDIPAWKEYSFPDVLTGLTFYSDAAIQSSGGASEYSLSITEDGSVLPHFQNGYRGPCLGRRLRLFSSGPPSDAYIGSGSSYRPTFVMPSSGTYAVKARSESFQVTTGGTATGISWSFKAGSIPPVISRGASAPSDTDGGGQASCTVRLPPSTPTGFVQGDIITLMEQPQKLGAALWQTIVWQLTVPYTSGFPPSDFSYTANPAIYPAHATIVPNAVTGLSGASAFGVTPDLPAGLSIDSGSGEISGTPTTATPFNVYAVTCTVAGATRTAYLAMTIT